MLYKVTCLNVLVLVQHNEHHIFQVIARIVDGSNFDEFKALYGDTLVTGKFLFFESV